MNKYIIQQLLNVKHSLGNIEDECRESASPHPEQEEGGVEHNEELYATHRKATWHKIAVCNIIESMGINQNTLNHCDDDEIIDKWEKASAANLLRTLASEEHNEMLTEEECAEEPMGFIPIHPKQPIK